MTGKKRTWEPPREVDAPHQAAENWTAKFIDRHMHDVSTCALVTSRTRSVWQLRRTESSGRPPQSTTRFTTESDRGRSLDVRVGEMQGGRSWVVEASRRPFPSIPGTSSGYRPGCCIRPDGEASSRRHALGKGEDHLTGEPSSSARPVADRVSSAGSPASATLSSNRTSTRWKPFAFCACAAPV
jgi:hypothetical protein